MKHIFLLFFSISISFFSFSQEYVKLKLSKEEIAKGMDMHYQRDATDGHYVVFDLFLFKNGQFEYSRADNLYAEYSRGTWKVRDGKLIFRSSIQKNELPIKVSYTPVDSNGKRRIAQIRNLKDDVPEAFVFINTDSIGCYYGDNLCKGSYDTIYMLKVGLENSEIQSPWIKVKQGNETIHLVIDTDINIKRYVVFNRMFKIKKDKLNEIP